MSKPTPRPWVYNGTKEIKSTYGDRLALCSERPNLRSLATEAEALANAAHIVKCVNTHEELVEALDRLTVELARLAQDTVYMSEELKAAMHAGFAALAKAKG